MGPIPFDNRERIESGAIYVAAIGAGLTFMTYIETTHALWQGMLSGAVAIAILLFVGALARRMA